MATALLFFPLSIHRNPNPRPYSRLRLSLSSSKTTHVVAMAVTTRRSVLTSPPPPTTSISDNLLDISKLGISEHVVDALTLRGIIELFPIQRAMLESAMEGRDMIGRAITGSGKTLAFSISVLDKIIRNKGQQRTYYTEPSTASYRFYVSPSGLFC